MGKYMQLMTSEWITLMVLAAVHLPLDQLQNLIHRLAPLKQPRIFAMQLKFHKALLDGELEGKSVQKNDSARKSDRNLALHSMYLHAREAMRLSKICVNEDSVTDSRYAYLLQQILDCRICLETAWKHGTRNDR